MPLLFGLKAFLICSNARFLIDIVKNLAFGTAVFFKTLPSARHQVMSELPESLCFQAISRQKPRE